MCCQAMADVIKTEGTAFVFNANVLLLTKISLKNVRHYSPSSFRSQLLTTGRPDRQVSQYCTNNYKQTNKQTNKQNTHNLLNITRSPLKSW